MFPPGDPCCLGAQCTKGIGDVGDRVLSEVGCGAPVNVGDRALSEAEGEPNIARRFLSNAVLSETFMRQEALKLSLGWV